MTRICHLITTLDVGGAEMNLFRLLSVMSNNRVSWSVISLMEAGRVGERIRELGIEVRSLGLRRGEVSLAPLLRLSRWLRREPPEILVTWLYHADLLVILAGRLAGLRCIVWNLRAAHAELSRYQLRTRWTLRLCSLLSRWPTAIIVNSESGRMFHSNIGYRPSRWVLIRNGVDHEVFKPDAEARREVRSRLGLRPENLLAGLVARFDPKKDHENFMTAALMVGRVESSVHFLLAGRGVGGDNRRLTAYLAGPPLAGRTHLLGERDDIPHLTAALDIACCSSSSEAFPNVLAEAMACGVTCVSTDVGDSAEILGETGILVPPGDPRALADGLLRAIRMGPLNRQALGQAARARVIEKFSLARSAREYEDFLSTLAGGRSATACNSDRHRNGGA